MMILMNGKTGKLGEKGGGTNNYLYLYYFDIRLVGLENSPLSALTINELRDKSIQFFI